MGRRRRARELAVQVQFHLEYNPGDPQAAFELVCETFNAPADIQPFAKALVLGIFEKKASVERLMAQASENWRLERMSRIDRCILRSAVYEILFMDDIPPKVSIDEAVELGKKYGSEDSARFINGVLDHIFTAETGGEEMAPCTV
jgi:transcription antitermination factor NusB